jgi:hypothetical protein
LPETIEFCRTIEPAFKSLLIPPPSLPWPDTVLDAMVTLIIRSAPSCTWIAPPLPEEPEFIANVSLTRTKLPPLKKIPPPPDMENTPERFPMMEVRSMVRSPAL